MDLPTQKFSIWFNHEQAKRFYAVWNLAKSRSRGRAKAAEVMKELMGFPLEEGTDAVVMESDRRIISEGLPALERVKPHRLDWAPRIPSRGRQHGVLEDRQGDDRGEYGGCLHEAIAADFTNILQFPTQAYPFICNSLQPRRKMLCSCGFASRNFQSGLS